MSGKPENTKPVANAATKALVLGRYADIQAPRPREPRLKLAYPLVSRRILSSHVSSAGNTSETTVVVDYLGGNGVRHVVGAISRETLTDEVAERILMFHTQVFASIADTIPAATLDTTLRMRSLKVRVEGNWQWDDDFLTTYDKDGVRTSVTRSQTFLRWRERPSR